MSQFNVQPSRSVPLLAAPPVRLALPTPQCVIAGLLPAIAQSSTRSTAQPYLVFDRKPTIAEVLRDLGPIRTREEMDAELAAIFKRPNAATTRQAVWHD